MRFLRDRTNVFISYSQKDWGLVKPVYDVLKLKSEIDDVFIDRILKPGDELSREILRKLRKCQYFLLFISENSLSSTWVEREKWIVQNLNTRCRIIPVVLDDSPIPDDLAHIVGDISIKDISDIADLSNRISEVIKVSPYNPFALLVLVLSVLIPILIFIMNPKYPRHDDQVNRLTSVPNKPTTRAVTKESCELEVNLMGVHSCTNTQFNPNVDLSLSIRPKLPDINIEISKQTVLHFDGTSHYLKYIVPRNSSYELQDSGEWIKGLDLTFANTSVFEIHFLAQKHLANGRLILRYRSPGDNCLKELPIDIDTSHLVICKQESLQLVSTGSSTQ